MYKLMRHFIRLFCLCLLLDCLVLGGALADAEVSLRYDYASTDAMDTTGLEPRVARILKSYYRALLPGELSFDDFHSVTFSGSYTIGEKEYTYSLQKQRPNYYRQKLTDINGQSSVVVYDGTTAWKEDSTQLVRNAEVLRGVGVDKLRLVSPLVGHLFYPKMPGKKISYSGLTVVDGERCVAIAVELPDGQSVISMIRSRGFTEKERVYTFSDGSELVEKYYSYRAIGGFHQPSKVVSIHGDNMLETVTTLDAIRINVGLPGYLFTYPVQD